MHAIRILFTPLILSALLSGCASLSKEECKAANWYAIGVEDGAQGESLEHLGEHRRACAEYGVTPQTGPYMAGRDEGLKSFCTYDRGFSHGRYGLSYNGVCPDRLAGIFLDGYQRGKEVYELKHRLDHVQDQIEKIKTALKNGIADPKSRAREVERLEDLSRDAGHLEKRIRDLSDR